MSRGKQEREKERSRERKRGRETGIFFVNSLRLIINIYFCIKET